MIVAFLNADLQLPCSHRSSLGALQAIFSSLAGNVQVSVSTQTVGRPNHGLRPNKYTSSSCIYWCRTPENSFYCCGQPTTHRPVLQSHEIKLPYHNLKKAIRVACVATFLLLTISSQQELALCGFYTVASTDQTNAAIPEILRRSDCTMSMLDDKPGCCPKVRPNCPRLGPPVPCTHDFDCANAADKCCFDRCLEQHVCKPARPCFG
ncbi:putative crustin-like antimicrobial peptide 12 [Homarus americanus]|uniref:Putative crustin-like antimicrobial peptide 12 n=1 Tax=Homarus americanus TaxID=6706 RepID=A0A8J5KE60_HOMAM|nr:putative crustin-like antimicrobial peptide 12 [Homarus americanus]